MNRPFKATRVDAGMQASQASEDSALLAALDLGSNTFRLEISRCHGQNIEPVAYYRERVSLGSGLDSNACLKPGTMQRGWDCLQRFAEHLQAMPVQRVRAAATQTVREAHNREQFLQPAQAILQHPITVLSGLEEAQLIYHGVSGLLAADGMGSDLQAPHLVLDVGGRSTELILGRNNTPVCVDSFALGSVSWSLRFFSQGVFSAAAFACAQAVAVAEFARGSHSYSSNLWRVAYGASETVGVVADVLRLYHRLGKDLAIEQASLDWLLERLLEAKNAQSLALLGLSENRRWVIGGGLAVLRGLFQAFAIKALYPTRGALRHGLIYEMKCAQA